MRRFFSLVLILVTILLAFAQGQKAIPVTRHTKIPACRWTNEFRICSAV